ncbi:MAG: undecaprenyldiphospho-muramoylpentapeptide beta-N-acetylglucosaminyltransferase [Candidatus Kerfeldbacteria bacterium]|nr:undecaprenyldiphospho-muramoylpentapeptide beta-N-acetylglucosaminyltransferase [Candidatus Kerfeldbacteria bacterium]
MPQPEPTPLRVLLTGGGTAGSVTPLFAIAERIKKEYPSAEFLFVGTEYGIEKQMAADEGFRYRSVSSGKLRRYFDFKNVREPWNVLRGFLSSLSIMVEFKPTIILSAGSFVSVPVVWAGWFHNVPIIIHQLDVRRGFANRLLTRFAGRITVTFEKSRHDFPLKKTVWTGNPIREQMTSATRKSGQARFQLDEDVPTVLIVGGGTGALAINHIVDQALPELTKTCQVIHVAGKGKNIFQRQELAKGFQPQYHELIGEEKDDSLSRKVNYDRYHVIEFLTDEIGDAMAAADLVVTRAGLGTLTELAALRKPALIIPLPDSHQEENAAYFASRGAAITLSQKTLTPEILTNHILQLLNNPKKLKDLSLAIQDMTRRDASSRFLQVFNEVLESSPTQ